MDRSATPEIPDSQESSPPPPSFSVATSRDNRIAMKTALRFGLPYSKITDTLGFTEA
jgi:hypothetical protein